MDELLLRHLRGQTTEKEDAAIDAWLKRSVDNGRALAELRRMLEAGRTADARLDPGDPPAAPDVIWRAEARVAPVGSRRLKPVRPRSRPRLRFLGGLAAAAVAALTAVGLWNALGTSGEATQAPLVAATAPGETEIVRLDDGSVIRLGPESHLTAVAGEAAREATLQGEAFFAIETDARRPFRIATAAGTAQVLGTRFHLAASANELAVTVVEGRVALAGPGQEVQVGAGQTTSLVRGRPAPVEAAAPIEAVAEWMAGFLIFHDTPLRVAREEIGKQYGIEVAVDDQALLDRTLTMWFDSKSLEEVMTVVCSVVDAQCSMGGGVVRMKGDGAGDGS